VLHTVMLLISAYSSSQKYYWISRNQPFVWPCIKADIVAWFGDQNAGMFWQMCVLTCWLMAIYINIYVHIFRLFVLHHRQGQHSSGFVAMCTHDSTTYGSWTGDFLGDSVVFFYTFVCSRMGTDNLKKSCLEFLEVAASWWHFSYKSWMWH